MGLLGTLGLQPTKAMLARASGQPKPPAGERAAAGPDGAALQAELRQRLDKLKGPIGKAVAIPGKAADLLKKRVEEAERALAEALRNGVKETADKAHRAIDVVETVLDEALSGKATKVEELADEARRKAEEELRLRLKNLKKNIDKALALPGQAADQVRKRVEEAEKELEDAVRAGVKSAVDKAHRAIDVVEMVVDEALGGGEASSKAQGQAGELRAQVVTLRAEAAHSLQSIQAAADRGKVEALLKALDAELAAADKLKDPAAQAKSLAALVGKARTVAALAAKLAGQAAAPVPGGRAAKPNPMQSPEMKTLVARFQQVMGQIKALAEQQSPRAADLKKAAVAAGNLSTSPKGIVQANAALDQVEPQIEDARRELAETQAGTAQAAGGGQGPGNGKADKAEADGKGATDSKAQVADARAKIQQLEARYRKAMDKQMDAERKAWLADAIKRLNADVDALERDGTPRDAKNLQRQIEWFENTVTQHEREAAGTDRDKLPDAKSLADEARQRLKALVAQGEKALAADPGNTNAGWLKEVAAKLEGQIADFEKRATQTDADRLRADLNWLEDGIAGWGPASDEPPPAPEPIAKEPEAKKEDSPELKAVKQQYRQVKAQIDLLAKEGNPQAEALLKAARDAGNLASSPAGIKQAKQALNQVKADVAKARAEAAKAQADAQQPKGDAEPAQTFDITVHGKAMKGLGREQAVAALHRERDRLKALLEGGWAFHVDQMNLPNEVPFGAWLTTGVDAVKSFFTGRDAAKIPDLNIWDPAREMLNDFVRAERSGDVGAMAAVLAPMEKAIAQARGKVGKYDEQMQDSAATGEAAGKFVEDTAASAIGAIAEKEGGKPAKVAAQAVAKGMFREVEQITEWALGMRREIDMVDVYKTMGQEAVGAIFKELVKGALSEPFKGAFGSYIGKAVDNKALAAMGISRDAFMTAAQKYLAGFAAGQGAGLIKAAVTGLISGKMPASPKALADAVAAELAKGSAKQLIVDGIKEIAKAAVTPK